MSRLVRRLLLRRNRIAKAEQLQEAADEESADDKRRAEEDQDEDNVHIAPTTPGWPSTSLRRPGRLPILLVRTDR